MKQIHTLVLLITTCCVPLLGVSAASGLDPAVGPQPRPSRPEQRRTPPVVERCTAGVADHPRPAARPVSASEAGGMCGGAAASQPVPLRAPAPRVEAMAPPTDDARRAYQRWEQARGPTAWQRQRARDVARGPPRGTGREKRKRGPRNRGAPSRRMLCAVLTTSRC
jgi:hypothetical protein